MQGLPPEDLEGSQTFPTTPPEGSPQQSEVQDTATPWVEGSDSLETFRIPHSSERRILRVNSFGDIVAKSSGLPTGPFISPGGQDPFWTTGIFRRDLFG